MTLPRSPATLALIVSLLQPPVAVATNLMNHQGFLTRADGTPVEGLHQLAFSFHETASTQTVIWGPQVFNAVPVLAGHYAVILGTTDTAGRSLETVPETGERYLSIRVDDEEMLPRLSIGALTTASTPPPSGDQTPAGLIAAYVGGQIPEGWLDCDGSLIPEGNRYDRLRAITGRKLPDLRGLFLRGLGQNADPMFRYEGDAGRNPLEVQQDAVQRHVHVMEDYTFSENAGNGGRAWGHLGQSDIDNAPASPFLHDTRATGGEETRPKNAGVHWMIKY